MSNPQQPGPFGSPEGGPQQPFNQGPSTPPGGQQPPPFGQQPAGQPQGQPYGQQPGQQFGQQPPPQFGQQPPAQGGFPGAPQEGAGFPAAPSGGGGKGKIVKIVIGLLVVIGLGIGAFVFFNKSAASANVGDCILVKDASATDADVSKVDCSKPEAVFKVAKKLDSAGANCPDEGDYLEYEQSSRRGGSSGGFSLCLMLNASKGDCFSDLSESDKARKVPCTDPKVSFEVLEIVEGKNEPEACTAEGVDNGFLYPEPKVTICGKGK